MIKASEDGQIDVQTGNWGATTSQKMSVSTQWKEQSVTFSGLTTEKLLSFSNQEILQETFLVSG